MTVDASADSERCTYLIFKINDTLYALLSSEVRELLRDVPVFKLPFVPQYVDGVLNRYGDPYAVVDPAFLLGASLQSASLFLVLQGESRVCLKITEVEDFCDVSSSDLRLFSENDAASFLSGTFARNGTEILVLNPNAVVDKVEKDLESA